MNAKPKGLKYRNLHARSGTIYYERRFPDGRRVKCSLGTDDWADAAAQRDALEEELRSGLGVQAHRLQRPACPTFAEVAESCLQHIDHLAPTTQEDYRRILGESGPLMSAFGPLRVDAITRRDLIDWWEAFTATRSTKTGRNHLDALATVFAWADARELLDANPLAGLRDVIGRRQRTKRGRAESAPEAHPIEAPAHIDALAVQARAKGGAAGLATLLMLDAGLRLGEATALDWQDVTWGRDGSDVERSLRIHRSRSRGRYLGKTKSGRERRVALSRRLRSMLLEAWIKAGRPAQGAVAQLDHSGYQNRTFPNLCRRAGVGDDHSPHDLRDTFASQLLSAGVQLAYVSRQLGHSNVAITARHYARWCGGDSYRPPIPLRPGEVPADLLARLEGEGGDAERHHIATSGPGSAAGA